MSTRQSTQMSPTMALALSFLYMKAMRKALPMSMMKNERQQSAVNTAMRIWRRLASSGLRYS